jgi:hypothetical protein
LDILIYFAYSYFIVRRYYAADLARQRDKSLVRYGYYPPGSAGAEWREIYPPVDEKSNDVVFKSIAANDNWIWATAMNNAVYVCKKPCDGSTEEAYWHQFPGGANLSQISVNNSSVWGVKDNVTWTMATSNDKGKWKKASPNFTNVSVGPTGRVAGLHPDRSAWTCAKPGQCLNTWKKQTKISSAQVAVGTKYIWSLDLNGNIRYKTGSDINDGPWADIKSPARMKYIAVGLKDNLFAISDDGTLYMKTDVKENVPWITVKNAPRLKALTVNKEIYGLGRDDTVWEGTIPK